jgi:hypothetical protein
MEELESHEKQDYRWQNSFFYWKGWYYVSDVLSFHSNEAGRGPVKRDHMRGSLWGKVDMLQMLYFDRVTRGNCYNFHSHGTVFTDAQTG